MLHEAIHITFSSLTSASACAFPVIVSEMHWKCDPTVVSYYCDTPEEKDISGVKHGDTAFSCIRCLITKDDISNLEKKARDGSRQKWKWRIYAKKILDVTDTPFRKVIKANA